MIVIMTFFHKFSFTVLVTKLSVVLCVCVLHWFLLHFSFFWLIFFVRLFACFTVFECQPLSFYCIVLAIRLLRPMRCSRDRAEQSKPKSRSSPNNKSSVVDRKKKTQKFLPENFEKTNKIKNRKKSELRKNHHTFVGAFCLTRYGISAIRNMDDPNGMS